MIRTLLLVAFSALASTCSKNSPAPVPTTTTVIDDASVPTESGCDQAYTRELELRCPPEEDARGGWVAVECPKLSTSQVSCIISSMTCAQTRLCQEHL